MLPPTAPPPRGRLPTRLAFLGSAYVILTTIRARTPPLDDARAGPMTCDRLISLVAVSLPTSSSGRDVWLMVRMAI
jgi:hypothetical protein